MNSEEVDRLIDELLDGAIAESDFLRLEAELHVDSSARQRYYDRIKLDTLIGVEAGERVLAPPRRSASPRLWVGVGMALAAALAVMAVVPAFLKGGDEPVAAGYAVLNTEIDAEWGGGVAFADGDLIPGGVVTLESGAAHLELFSGVSVVVEGPAVFEVRSPMAMTVRSGKIRAHVPDAAHGFRVTTAHGDVVDLGTEFAVAVGEETSEVHVLDGEVEWHGEADDAVTSLDGGEALRIAEGGEAELGAAEQGRFAGADDLERRQLERAGERAGEMAAWRQSFAQDPRLVLYLPMESDEGRGRSLSNHAAAGAASDGAIVAARHLPGRPGLQKGGLDFSPTGSRVRVSVPGEYSALTFLCWAKIEQLDRWYNSLFLTDSYEFGEPHWQIMDDGRIHFSIRPEVAAKHHVAYSPSLWDPTMTGRWIMLATTYDSATGEVAHFLDGEELSREVVPEERRVNRVVIGDASIGNWSLPQRDDPEFAIRNLNGMIDEFAIFSTALRPDELAEIYQNGRP